MDFQELRDSFLSSPDRTPRNPRFWCAEEKVMLYWDTVSQSAWNRWPEHNPSGKGYGLMYLMFSDTSKYARLESSGIRDRL